jgi:thiol-disulfide isomerase/thioredoxin
MLLVLVVSLLQTQPAAPPATPQDCITIGRDFSTKRLKELGPTTGDTVRQVTTERVAMLRECAAKFDMMSTPPVDLAPLVDLYVESQQMDLAQKALARGLADTSLDVPAKGNLLMLAVRTTLRHPKSAERNATAERYVEQLDALGDAALEQRITAHSALNNYYRGDDIDEGIIRHSTWMIDAGKRLDAEQRKKFAGSMISAYVNLAEAVAGQGDNDRAIELLKRAPAEWPEAAAAGARVKDVLARYMLVGTAAPPISAPVWLNRADTAPLDLKGKVTLLEFTAHWCGPCKESYPGMKRLQQRFPKDAFEIVFYTRTYGYFEKERNLSPEHEIERDRKYYADYGLTMPIAIGPPSSVMVDGKAKFPEDPVENAYAVGGIPQINVIDKKGNIRLVMIGYDDANEEKLASFIQGLLREASVGGDGGNGEGNTNGGTEKRRRR